MRAAPKSPAIRVIAGGRAAGLDYSVIELRLRGGHDLPPHALSREDCLMLVLDGELEVKLGDQLRTLKAGEVLQLPRTLPRRVTVATSAHILLVAVPAGIEELADAIGDASMHPDDTAALLAGFGVDLLPSGWGSAR